MASPGDRIGAEIAAAIGVSSKDYEAVTGDWDGFSNRNNIASAAAACSIRRTDPEEVMAGITDIADYIDRVGANGTATEKADVARCIGLMLAGLSQDIIVSTQTGRVG